MKHIKKITIALFCLAGVASTGCELSHFTPDDCSVNANYEIECDPFEPGLDGR